MARVAIRLEFEGAGFCGWQKQADDREAADKPSVQSVVEEGLARVLRSPERVVVWGCGRTDAGVHAEEFFIHFEVAGEVDALRVERLRHALNAVVPSGLAATGAWLMPSGFHALDDVVSKTYEYRILLRRSPPTLLRGRCLWLPIEPSNDSAFSRSALKEALALLPGEHDFAAFASSGGSTRTTIRRILEAEGIEEALGVDDGQGRLWRLRFTGTGFLKQMVRNLVGTLVEIAQGRRAASELSELLATNRARQEAGFCAPPEGLFLTRVRYPDSIEALWTASGSLVASGS